MPRRRTRRCSFRVPGRPALSEHASEVLRAQSLANFAREFHEPFYEDYLRDDIAALLGEARFRVESVTPAFLSKVVVASA